MSSKARARKVNYDKRVIRRKLKAAMAKDWKCGGCGHVVPSWSPICLCGKKRSMTMEDKKAQR